MSRGIAPGSEVRRAILEELGLEHQARHPQLGYRLPPGRRQRARLAALNSRTWNTPALAAPYLLLRNDREAVCYELAVTDG